MIYEFAGFKVSIMLRNLAFKKKSYIQSMMLK